MKHFFYLLPLVGVFFLGCASGPSKGGVSDGRLADCPGSPNCVSSQAADGKHKIAALRFSGDAKAAMDRLAAVVSSMKGAKVEERTDGYMHAVFTSGVFRFKDDVEFLAAPEKGVIEVRSASRLGYSDFGVNRRRVEAIRKLFEKD